METSKMENEGESLQKQLEKRQAEFASQADDEKKRIYREGIDKVAESGVLEGAAKVGDQASDFRLTNAAGQEVSLQQYLNKGLVILTWYRGNWCPYCNLSLHALQQELADFKAEGANLIALSPELPDESLSTAEKHSLEFEVLSDPGNKVARQYGIVFKLTDDVAEIYNESFQLNEHNGDQSNELPLAATFIINQAGEIIYAFVDADYRKRAEPAELTRFLKEYNESQGK